MKNNAISKPVAISEFLTAKNKELLELQSALNFGTKQIESVALIEQCLQLAPVELTIGKDYYYEPLLAKDPKLVDFKQLLSEIKTTSNGFVLIKDGKMVAFTTNRHVPFELFTNFEFYTARIDKDAIVINEKSGFSLI